MIKLLGWLGVYFQPNPFVAKAAKVRPGDYMTYLATPQPRCGGAVSKSTSRKIPKKHTKSICCFKAFAFRLLYLFWEHRATKSIPQTRLTSGFVQIAIYPWAHRSSLKRLQTISAQPRLCGNGITSLIWFPAAAAAATGHMIIKIIDIVWPLQVSRQFSCFIWSVCIVPSACLHTILTTIL